MCRAPPLREQKGIRSMDTRIQSYLRAAAGRRRDCEGIGPFLATFDRHSDNPYRNYAIPDDGATPSAADVRALVAAFEARDCTPRLEYLPAAAPIVEAALLAHGFAVEGRLPLMTIAPGAAQDLPAPPGVELVLPVTDAELLATARVQNEAYGESTTTEHDVERLRATLTAGGIVMLARGTAAGEPIGAGLCSPPTDRVTEIAAIGVVPSHRRRGVGGALCARLLHEALAAGITTPFLMAAHEAEERIYARVGFTTNSDVLLISRPRVNAPARN